MEFDAILGGSYESQSPLADCERTVNWYPEALQSANATARRVLYPTPGVSLITQASSGFGRAHFAMQGREFAVIGPTFYEIEENGNTTSRGALASDDNPATISSNGDIANQLFITSGGNGYIFALDTNTLTQIAALNGRATMGGHLDGYFLALDANTSTLLISELADGLTWLTGLEEVQRSAMPDRWLSMKVVGRFIWLLGERSSEIWYNSGGLVPFSLYPGAPIMQFGVKAPFSPAIIGDNIIWLAVTASGRICVCLGTGVSAQVISTYPLETALYNYTLADKAVGDAYSDRGHTFYLIGFDPDHITWAFDLETKLWHERGTWNATENRYDSWRTRFYAFAFNEHRMLDRASPGIFRMSDREPRDAGGINIRRLRRAPALSNGNERIFYSSLELFMEPGLGVNLKLQTPGACFSWVSPHSYEVSFDSTCSSGTITTYAWDFGDGDTATTASPDHTYADGNPYTVTLTVTGPNGSSFCTSVVYPQISEPDRGVSSGSYPVTTVTTPLDPQVMLRISNDAGKTWVSEQWRSAGKVGEWNKRVRWNGLGSARRRVFEVSVTDPVPWRLMGADLQISQSGPGGGPK